MWKSLLLLSIATILSLLMAEVVVRLVLPRPGFEPYLPHRPSGLLVPHPNRDYAHNPDFVGEIITEEYHINIAINSLGMRDDEIGSNEEVDVLAVGNSFTAGHGVQADEAWPSRLESLLDSAVASPRTIRVVNAGVSGYSLTQIRLLIEESLHLEPRLVVLGLYASRYWRIGDPYIYFNGQSIRRSRVPHLKVIEDGYLYSSFNSRNLRHVHFLLMENFYVGVYALNAAMRLERRLRRSNTPTEARKSEDELAPLLSEIGKISLLLQDRGIKLVVLLVNHQENDGSFSRSEKRYNATVKSYCGNAGIPVFDPVPYFESFPLDGPLFRIGNDHHWSKRAHALVGNQLGLFLLQRDWLLSSLGKTR